MTAVFFPCEPKALILCDDLAPVRMAERRIDRRDIVRVHAFRREIRAQDPVGGARVDVVGSKQNPAANLAAFLAHQVANGRNGLLAWRSAGVENIARAFLAFVLNGIEQQAVQSLEHGKHRLAGGGSPATEHDRGLVLREQLEGLVGKGIRVRCGVDDDRLQFPAEQPALLVLVRDQHKDRVLERGFADGHGAGQRVQDADLDGVLGGVSRRDMENEQRREQPAQDPGQLHADTPTSSKIRVSFVMPLATTASRARNSN